MVPAVMIPNDQGNHGLGIPGTAREVNARIDGGAGARSNINREGTIEMESLGGRIDPRDRINAEMAQGRIPRGRQIQADQVRPAYLLPKPVAPSQLTRLDNMDKIQEFVDRFESFREKCGDDRVSVHDYVSVKLWNKKREQYPDVFRRGNNQMVLDWLREQIRQEKQHMRTRPWKYLAQIKFDPVGRSLYRAIMLFLADVRRMLAYARTDRVRRLMLKRAVLQLPSQLQYCYEDVFYGQIDSVDQLEREVEAQEQSLNGHMTSSDRKRLRREARARLEKYEAKGHFQSQGDNYQSDNGSVDRRRSRRRRERKGRRGRRARSSSGSSRSGRSRSGSRGRRSDTSSNTSDTGSRSPSPRRYRGESDDSKTSRRGSRKDRRYRRGDRSQRKTIRAHNPSTGAGRGGQLAVQPALSQDQPSFDVEADAQVIALRKALHERRVQNRVAELTEQLASISAPSNGPKSQDVSASLVRTEAQDDRRKQPDDESQVISVDEVMVFAAEEAQAVKLGLCYACHQPGHMRRNCPMLALRRGMPRRIKGLCFNCGQEGHVWRDCKLELKPHLRSILDRGIQTRRGPGATRGLNPPQGVNPMGGTNNPPLPQKEPVQQQDQQKPQPTNYRQPGARSVQVETDICVARVLVERQRTVKMSKVWVQVRADGEWEKVRGKPDSGADCTIGSIQLHRTLCREVWTPVGSLMHVRTATSERAPVVMKGLIKLKIDDKELPLSEILLVDSPTWENLLVGEDLLQHTGLSIQSQSNNNARHS